MRFQRLPDGRFRSQPRDPLRPDERLDIITDSEIEMNARLKKIADIRRELRYGMIDPLEARRILRPVTGRLLTVCEVWERYFKGVPASSRSIAKSSWKNKLEPWFGKLFAWQLDKTLMRGWQTELQDKKAASKSIESAFYYLQAAFKLIVDDGQLDKIPWSDYRPPKGRVERKPAAAGSVDELARIIMAARALDETNWRKGRYADRHVVLLVLALSGMRQAEACGLAWDHVEIDGPCPQINIEVQAKRDWRARTAGNRPTDETKTKKPRVLLISPDCATALRAHRDRLKAHGRYRIDGPVFPGKKDRFRTSQRVMKPEDLRPIVERAGLPNVARWVTHSMRHSFSSLETNASGDLRATMDRTGHSSVDQLMGYVHRLGHGMPAPAMPRLPQAVIDTIGENIPGAPLPPFADLLRVNAETAQAIQNERDEKKRAERAESELPFDEVARKYLAEGSELDSLLAHPPREVKATLRRAYVRGYQRARRKKGDAAACKRAGRAAERAALGAWAKVARGVYRAANAGRAQLPPSVEIEGDPWGLSGVPVLDSEFDER